MASRFSSKDVISFFSGEDSGLSEVVFAGSDDDLGMEDMENDDSEAAFEPLEVTDQGE